MPSYDTKFSTLNLTTSLAVYLANSFVDAGWAVYWQETGVMSGTALNGEVTLVAEFPSEPNDLVPPPKTRTQGQVIIPAFSVQVEEPIEVSRMGLGEDLFFQRTTVTVEGYVNSLAEHMAFATMLRNWFRDGYNISIYDYDSSPTAPSLVSDQVRFERRDVQRIQLLDVPETVRYYINMKVDVVYAD